MTVEPLDTEYWREEAACAGVDPELFYPDKRSDHERIRSAKMICRNCEVSTQCLSEALSIGEPHGIWGGYMPDEREVIRAARGLPFRKPPEIFPHGTAAGYARHARAGQIACRACVRAHTRDRREWKERNR